MRKDIFMLLAKVPGQIVQSAWWKSQRTVKNHVMQAEATVPNKDALQIDFRVLVSVHRDALADANMLEEYLAKRGKELFDEDGYDHITLLQAKLLGLLDF